MEIQSERLRFRALTAVIAQTHKTNVASDRVLEKAGFTICDESEEAFSWRLDRSRKYPQR